MIILIQQEITFTNIVQKEAMQYLKLDMNMYHKEIKNVYYGFIIYSLWHRGKLSATKRQDDKQGSMHRSLVELLLVQLLMMLSPVATDQIQHLISSNRAVLLYADRACSNLTDNILDFTARHSVACPDIVEDGFDTRGRNTVDWRRV
jgi:midasin (ATPase involved in ribosome maturation)